MVKADRLPAPRPQMDRGDCQSLCGEWSFRFDDDDEGVAERWHLGTVDFPLRITVPYPPESELSGLRSAGDHPILWYKREEEIASPDGDERVLLYFGAVDYTATVWVNGQRITEHEGGHTTFFADITEAMVAGTQTIVVRAQDPADDVRIPRGKQSWRASPHRIWYHRTSGIWQPVWIERVPGLYIEQLHWTPELAHARVRCDVRLNRLPKAPMRLDVRLEHAGSVLADQSVQLNDIEASFDVTIPALRHGQDRDRLLWTPETPNLIDAHVTIVTDTSAPGDTVRSYLGLRECGVDAGVFLLNETPYFLRMVLGQNYWPNSHLAAPGREALRREVALIKAMGFNGVRVHQKIEDPQFLYWCDVMGLLVWEEMPSCYSYSTSTVGRLCREWMEAIRRDCSHPCIVAWVPLNESWGVPHIATNVEQQHCASALYHLTKALDPSRPVISNDGWEMVETDIISIHDYAVDGDGLRARFHDQADIDRMIGGMGPARHRVMLGARQRGDRPVMLTEFGGISFTPKTAEAWHGYATVSDAEALEARLRDYFATLHAAAHIAGYCYTQLTDTEQEKNGLLTEDREPKLPLATICSIVRQPSAAMPYEPIVLERERALRASGGIDGGEDGA